MQGGVETATFYDKRTEQRVTVPVDAVTKEPVLSFGQAEWHAHPHPRTLREEEEDKRLSHPMTVQEALIRWPQQSGSIERVPLLRLLQTLVSNASSDARTRVYVQRLVSKFGRLEQILSSIRFKVPGTSGQERDQIIYATYLAGLPLRNFQGLLDALGRVILADKQRQLFSREDRDVISHFFRDDDYDDEGDKGPGKPDCAGRVMGVSQIRLASGRRLVNDKWVPVVRRQVTSDPGYTGKRDPVNNDGIYEDYYVCCGQSLDHPGCLIDTYSPSNAQSVPASIGGHKFRPYDIIDQLAADAQKYEKLAARWIESYVRGTAFFSRDAYDALDRRIRELLPLVAPTITEAFMAVSERPADPATWFFEMGPDALNRLVVIYDCISKYNAYRCSPGPMPRTPFEWIRFFEINVVKPEMAYKESLVRPADPNKVFPGLVQHPGSPFLDQVTRRVFDHSTIAAISRVPLYARQPSAVRAPGPPPPPMAGRGAKGFAKKVAPKKAVGGGGGPPPPPPPPIPGAGAGGSGATGGGGGGGPMVPFDPTAAFAELTITFDEFSDLVKDETVALTTATKAVESLDTSKAELSTAFINALAAARSWAALGALAVDADDQLFLAAERTFTGARQAFLANIKPAEDALAALQTEADKVNTKRTEVKAAVDAIEAAKLAAVAPFAISNLEDQMLIEAKKAAVDTTVADKLTDLERDKNRFKADGLAAADLTAADALEIDDTLQQVLLAIKKRAIDAAASAAAAAAAGGAAGGGGNNNNAPVAPGPVVVVAAPVGAPRLANGVLSAEARAYLERTRVLMNNLDDKTAKWIDPVTGIESDLWTGTAGTQTFDFPAITGTHIAYIVNTLIGDGSAGTRIDTTVKDLRKLYPGLTDAQFDLLFMGKGYDNVYAAFPVAATQKKVGKDEFEASPAVQARIIHLPTGKVAQTEKGYKLEDVNALIPVTGWAVSNDKNTTAEPNQLDTSNLHTLLFYVANSGDDSDISKKLRVAGRMWASFLAMLLDVTTDKGKDEADSSQFYSDTVGYPKVAPGATNMLKALYSAKSKPIAKFKRAFWFTVVTDAEFINGQVDEEGTEDEDPTFYIGRNQPGSEEGGGGGGKRLARVAETLFGIEKNPFYGMFDRAQQGGGGETVLRQLNLDGPVNRNLIRPILAAYLLAVNELGGMEELAKVIPVETQKRLGLIKEMTRLIAYGKRDGTPPVFKTALGPVNGLSFGLRSDTTQIGHLPLSEQVEILRKWGKLALVLKAILDPHGSVTQAMVDDLDKKKQQPPQAKSKGLIASVADWASWQ